MKSPKRPDSFQPDCFASNAIHICVCVCVWLSLKPLVPVTTRQYILKHLCKYISNPKPKLKSHVVAISPQLL